MSQGPPAPEYGVVVVTLAPGVTCVPGSPIAINSSGLGYLANKATGNTLAIGLALNAGTAGEEVPVQFGGPLTLPIAQWDAVALSGGSASTTGLVPGGGYGQYTSGLMNTGSGTYGSADIAWQIGIALTTETILVAPGRVPIAG